MNSLAALMKKTSVERILLALTGLILGFYPTFGPFGAMGAGGIILVLVILIKFVRHERVEITLAAGKLATMFAFSAGLIFVGLTIASAINSPGSAGDVLRIGGQYVAVLLCVFLALSTINEREHATLINWYIAGGFALAILGAVVYLMYFDLGRRLGWIWSNGRLYMFSGPNALAPQMAFLSIIFIYHGFAKNSWPKSLILLILIPFLVVLFSGSNTGIIIYLVTVTPVLFLVSRTTGLIFAVFLIVGLWVGLQNLEYISAATGSSSILRFSWILEGDLESAGSFGLRSGTIQIALDYALNNPVIGAGAGAANKYGLISNIDQSGSQPHNAFVLIWVEGGILALVGLLLWFVTSFYGAFVISGANRQFLLSIIAATVGIMFMRPHSYQFWLIFPSMQLLTYSLRVRKTKRQFLKQPRGID